MKRFKHPFTLVELLCVIIVIALLAAISIKVTQVAYRRADESTADRRRSQPGTLDRVASAGPAWGTDLPDFFLTHPAAGFSLFF